MGDLGATLIKELNCETAFTIGGIGISESVVVTWIMMAVVLVVSLIVTHGLKVEHPGRGSQPTDTRAATSHRAYALHGGSGP